MLDFSTLMEPRNLMVLAIAVVVFLIYTYVKKGRIGQGGASSIRPAYVMKDAGTVLEAVGEEFARVLFIDGYGGFCVQPGAAIPTRRGRVWRRVYKTHTEQVEISRKKYYPWLRAHAWYSLVPSRHFTFPQLKRHAISYPWIKTVETKVTVNRVVKVFDEAATQALRTKGQVFILNQGDPGPVFVGSGVMGRYKGPPITRHDYRERLSLAQQLTQHQALTETPKDIIATRLAWAVIVAVVLAFCSWAGIVAITYFKTGEFIQ